jgi:hypothetical protein
MASRNRDPSAAGLLRQSLAHPAGPQGAEANCPAPDILAAYCERSLDAAETARCDLHFSQCARCREQLAALARADEFAATREKTPQPKAGWVWLFDWRWLASAAAVLAIVIVWVARHPAPNQTAEQTPPPSLVAMSQSQEPPTALRPGESLPEAKVAIPRASGAAEPAARPAPNLSLNTAPSAPLQQLPEPAPSEQSARNLPLRGRDNAQLDELAKYEQAPPKPSAVQNVVAGAAEPNATAPAPRSELSSPPAAPPPPTTPAPGAKGMIAAETVAVQSEARPALSRKADPHTRSERALAPYAWRVRRALSRRRRKLAWTAAELRRAPRRRIRARRKDLLARGPRRNHPAHHGWNEMEDDFAPCACRFRQRRCPERVVRHADCRRRPQILDNGRRQTLESPSLVADQAANQAARNSPLAVLTCGGISPEGDSPCQQAANQCPSSPLSS